MRYTKSQWEEAKKKSERELFVWRVKFVGVIVGLFVGLVGFDLLTTWLATGDMRCAVVRCVIVK